MKCKILFCEANVNLNELNLSSVVKWYIDKFYCLNGIFDDFG